jgi:hypothetical protein
VLLVVMDQFLQDRNYMKGAWEEFALYSSLNVLHRSENEFLCFIPPCLSMRTEVLSAEDVLSYNRKSKECIVLDYPCSTVDVKLLKQQNLFPFSSKSSSSYSNWTFQHCGKCDCSQLRCMSCFRCHTNDMIWNMDDLIFSIS